MLFNTDEMVRIVKKDGNVESSTLSNVVSKLVISKTLNEVSDIKRVDRIVGTCLSRKHNLYENDILYLESRDIPNVVEVYQLFITEHNLKMYKIHYMKPDGEILTMKELYQAKDIEERGDEVEKRQPYTDVGLLEDTFIEYLGINALNIEMVEI